jgi:SlyX protein
MPGMTNGLHFYSISIKECSMDDARLVDLEIRLTHQEATLQTLNDVVAEQQGLIDQLRKEVEALKRQLRDMTPDNIAAPWEETPPPHY